MYVRSHTPSSTRGRRPSHDEDSLRPAQAAALAACSIVGVAGDMQLTFDAFASHVRCHTNLDAGTLLPIFMSVNQRSSHVSRTGISVGLATCSLNDFFLWSLSSSESGIEQAFMNADRSGEGVLDPLELFSLAEAVGFGDLASDLLRELDHDLSGSLSLSELLLSVRNTPPTASFARAFLLTLGFRGDALAPLRALDGGSWPYDRVRTFCEGLDLLCELEKPEVLDELRSLLASIVLEEQAIGVAGLYAHLLGEGPRREALLGRCHIDWRLSKTRFVDGLLRLGYPTSKAPLLDELFGTIDADENGYIDFNEVYSWLHGLLRRAAAARALTLSGDRGDEAMPLAQLEWGAARGSSTLRLALRQLLLPRGLDAADLFRAYDVGSDGSLGRAEFLRMGRQLVGDDELWQAKVCDAPPLRCVVESADSCAHQSLPAHALQAPRRTEPNTSLSRTPRPSAIRGRSGDYHASPGCAPRR